MSKRAGDELDGGVPLKSGERPINGDNNEDGMEFEDAYEDEYESEEEIFEAGVDGRPDAEREAEAKDSMDIDVKEQTFIPGRSVLQPGQTLTPDPSTYEMLHGLSAEWPCLSFDIVRDNLADNRKQYPRTVYAVAGTQAQSTRARDNQLLVLKLSSLGKMDNPDSDSEEDDDDDETSDPVLESRSIQLPCTTNRIRCFQPQQSSEDRSQISPTYTATSLENAQIQIHNITPHLKSLSTPGFVVQQESSKPLATLRMHKEEGYGLAWASAAHYPYGRLLSGDCAGQIFSTIGNESGNFSPESKPFLGHTAPVEELQWSPSEKSVFASAGSDGTVKVWDVRSKSRKPAVDVHVSNTDVNVMSWSHLTTYLLATGADDGEWAVWDLRSWKNNSVGPIKSEPVANYKFHKQPITSIEWHPTDDSVVGVASADGTVTLWDLSVEIDDEEYGREAGLGLGEGSEKVPPQLLFIHHSEKPKELHWHPQMPGTMMVTGDNFGVFKTISV